MEKKELKVQVPEGYEIDTENSIFECIKFKPIKKYITYNDVCDTIFVNEDNYFVSDGGCIHKGILPDWDNGIIPNKNIATNKRQLEKLLALNQLLNIAEYYNKLHPKQDDYPYCIVFEDEYGYFARQYHTEDCYYGLIALFNNNENAQAVIDNPNFREILDTIYKN